MTARWLVLLAVAACGGASKPTARPAAPAAPKPAPAPVCIAPPDEDARIEHATGDAELVRYCVGDGQERCFSLDLVAGKLERLPAPPSDGAAPAPHVEVVAPKLEVCVSGTCTPLTAKVLPTTSSIRGATNADGTVAVFLLGDTARGAGYAEVWDVAKSKKLATFRYARGDFRCGKVALLGDTIFVSASVCGQPAARAALYSQKGAKIANVGGRDFGSYGEAYVQIDGTTWAFLEENGNVLAIQDVAKGKVKKTIELALLWKRHGAEMGNPGESALVRMADGRLAVIAGAPATGSVAMIDVATGELTVVPAPQCGAM